MLLSLALLTVFSAALPSCKEIGESPQASRSRDIGIILNDDTALRLDPIIYSSRVTLLKKGDSVEILDRSREKTWIQSSQDYWYKVKLSKGISGWIFGKNIKVFTNKSKSTIDSYISNLWETETTRLRENLTGKWWSVNYQGDFTSHCLEIYGDGKYRSYVKGGKPIEGEYNFNFTDNEVVFLKGTSMGHNLNFAQRGNSYNLEKILEKEEIKFKKISVNPRSEVEEEPLEPKGKEKEDAHQ